MKKLIAVLLVCILITSFITVASAETVVSYTYDEETTEILDEGTPGSGQITGEVLPQTGGIPVEIFYGLGIVFIVAALFISIKKISTPE